ncbi:MAG: class I SAM-dependent methyltransferase [Planctomycetota bacterium]|jgi:hypothetical protein
MPASDFFNQPHISKTVQQHDCQTALEVGIGWGNIGAYLKKEIPNLPIDGIEIWQPYENKQWQNYDNVWINDFCDFSIEPIYDTILAIDVIEHLETQRALYQIERFKKLAQKVLVLSVPIVPYPQGAAFGNPYEVHRSIWNVRIIQNLGFELVAKNNIIGVFKANGGGQ